MVVEDCQGQLQMAKEQLTQQALMVARQQGDMIKDQVDGLVEETLDVAQETVNDMIHDLFLSDSAAFTCAISGVVATLAIAF